MRKKTERREKEDKENDLEKRQRKGRKEIERS